MVRYYKEPKHDGDVKRAKKSWNARLGMPTTTSDTTQAQLTMRSQGSRKNRTKPSMPKMPWDKEDA